MKKLYVGNLPFSLTEDQVHAMFAECGSVASAKLITDKFSGQSKGFAFVEMSNDGEADAATTKLNGTSIDGRQIVVNEARPMVKREGGSRGGFGGGRGGFGGGHGGGGGRGGFRHR